VDLTFSLDERLVKEARKVASAMGKSLNQLLREYLEELTAVHGAAADVEEVRRLSAAGQGQSRGWRFDRDEIHERGKG
jgi:hypothetical protein